LQLESAIDKLDKFDPLILDDLAYVTKDQAETSVLFELISARYERRSIMITAKLSFGEWPSVFGDPAMTLAAVETCSSRNNLRDECRKLSAKIRHGSQTPAWQTRIIRDNQQYPGTRRGAAIRSQRSSCHRQLA
jgi:hypothetical protein